MAAFDSIMMLVEIGGSRKFRRLTPDQRWCAVAGVWCLAAKSPVRGYLLVTDKEAMTDQDVADQAGVKLSVARSTLQKMRDLGMLEWDDELQAEHVHDWHLHQPEPKSSENRQAWRERKRAQREREKQERHGNVTRDIDRDTLVTVTPLSQPNVPPPEEKRRKEKGREYPPDPPKGGRQRDLEQWEGEFTAWVQAHPVTDELSAEWESIEAKVAGAMGDDISAFRTKNLHPHLSTESTLVLGGVMARWVEEHYGRFLQQLAGREVRVIDCRCERAMEQAA